MKCPLFGGVQGRVSCQEGDRKNHSQAAVEVEAESTRTVMVALRQVIEQPGVFGALSSDRASPFFLTPKAGEPVDRKRLTPVGRALNQLGLELIPSYSPQARGRGERHFQTWQGRLPQELRRRGIKTVEEANRFLRKSSIREFNRCFTVPAAEPGSALVPVVKTLDLDRIFSLHHQRVVHRDHTASWANPCLQIEKTSGRGTLAGGQVTV